MEGKADPEAADTRMDGGIRAYWAEYNLQSVDGLPAMLSACDVDEAPLSTWKKEDEKNRRTFGSNKDDASAGRVGNKVVVSEAMVHKQVIPFFLGVFATMLCARLLHISF